MKTLAGQLLKKIAESHELDPLFRHELIEFITAMCNIQYAVQTSRAFAFTSCFISSRELEMDNTPSLLALLGYSEEEKPAFSFSDFFRCIHPDDIAEFSLMLEQFYDNKCSCYSGLFRLMHRSGDYKWMFGRACLAGNDEMTGKPVLTGTFMEVCFKFNTPLKLELLNMEYKKMKPTNNKHKFTAQDVEIVKLMIEGHTIEKIALLLHISSSTLNYRKTKMFNITNTTNASALTNYFISHGLV